MLISKKRHLSVVIVSLSLTLFFYADGFGQRISSDVVPPVVFGPYDYEVKPDHEAFRIYNPRKAPRPGALVFREGDRLAICGDSITEQRMYSRMIETYLTVCVPQLRITVRQYGWSGEKTDGFLRRMESDCLRFQPTVATLAYGMNDSRYRPFDVTNGQWYDDHYTAIVRRFKQDGVRVIVGSPGCAGKLAGWVNPRAGTLEDHNLHLCALRDIALGVANREQVPFADIFWPMLQAQVFGPEQHHATAERPYEVAGSDGIHPNWAGHVVMAYAFLRAMGLDGNLGTITWNSDLSKVEVSGQHRIVAQAEGSVTIESHCYPYCATGDPDSDATIRSGMSLVPFMEDLNRFVVKIPAGTDGRYRITWGSLSREFDAAELATGIILPREFPDNPFSEPFTKVDEAVAAKQAYETKQVKEVFHGELGKKDIDKAVRETEQERKPLADAIPAAFKPITHTLTIKKL